MRPFCACPAAGSELLYTRPFRNSAGVRHHHPAWDEVGPHELSSRTGSLSNHNKKMVRENPSPHAHTLPAAGQASPFPGLRVEGPLWSPLCDSPTLLEWDVPRRGSGWGGRWRWGHTCRTHLPKPWASGGLTVNQESKNFSPHKTAEFTQLDTWSPWATSWAPPSPIPQPRLHANPVRISSPPRAAESTRRLAQCRAESGREEEPPGNVGL